MTNLKILYTVLVLMSYSNIGIAFSQEYVSIPKFIDLGEMNCVCTDTILRDGPTLSTKHFTVNVANISQEDISVVGLNIEPDFLTGNFPSGFAVPYSPYTSEVSVKPGDTFGLSLSFEAHFWDVYSQNGLPQTGVVKVFHRRYNSTTVDTSSVSYSILLNKTEVPFLTGSVFEVYQHCENRLKDTNVRNLDICAKIFNPSRYPFTVDSVKVKDFGTQTLYFFGFGTCNEWSGTRHAPAVIEPNDAQYLGFHFQFDSTTNTRIRSKVRAFITLHNGKKMELVDSIRVSSTISPFGSLATSNLVFQTQQNVVAVRQDCWGVHACSNDIVSCDSIIVIPTDIADKFRVIPSNCSLPLKLLPDSTGYGSVEYHSDKSGSRIATLAAFFTLKDGTKKVRFSQMEVRVSGSVGVEPEKPNHSDKPFVYPNPATNNIYLFLPHNSKLSFITITDANGKVRDRSILFDDSVDINTGSLETGTYFLSISGGCDGEKRIVPFQISR